MCFTFNLLLRFICGICFRGLLWLFAFINHVCHLLLWILYSAVSQFIYGIYPYFLYPYLSVFII